MPNVRQRITILLAILSVQINLWYETRVHRRRLIFESQNARTAEKNVGVGLRLNEKEIQIVHSTHKSVQSYPCVRNFSQLPRTTACAIVRCVLKRRGIFSIRIIFKNVDATYESPGVKSYYFCKTHPASPSVKLGTIANRPWTVDTFFSLYRIIVCLSKCDLWLLSFLDKLVLQKFSITGVFSPRTRNFS